MANPHGTPATQFKKGNKAAKGGPRPNSGPRNKEKKAELLKALEACDAKAIKCWAKGLDPDNKAVSWKERVVLMRIHAAYRIGVPKQTVEITGTAGAVRDQIDALKAGNIVGAAMSAAEGAASDGSETEED